MKLIAIISLIVVAHLAIEQSAGQLPGRGQVGAEVGGNLSTTEEALNQEVQSLSINETGVPYKAAPGAFPFVAKLVSRDKSRPSCGGVIMSNRKILTTNLCANDIDFIQFGEFHSSGGFRAKVYKVTPDPGGLAMISTVDDIWDEENEHLIKPIRLLHDPLKSRARALELGFNICNGGKGNQIFNRWSTVERMSAADLDEPVWTPQWIDSEDALVIKARPGMADYGFPLVVGAEKDGYKLVGMAHSMYGDCRGFAYIQVAKHLGWILNQIQ